MTFSFASFADELVKIGAAPKSILTPGSSNVRGWRYDAKTQQMFVTFKGGATYRYSGVPPAVAKSFQRSKSVGKAVSRRLKAPGYEYEKVGAKLAKSYTCKFCKEPATKGVIWAEGRAIVPCCEKHLAKGKGSVDEVDTVRDLTKTSMVRERIREGGKVAEMVKEAPKLNAQERFVRSRSGMKSSPTARYYARKRRLSKLAGAAKKQVTWQGLTMKIEYEKGDERSGVNGATGKKWSRTMHDNYGYMPGTYGKGADGEAIDVYFSPRAGDETGKVVYKIRQKKKTGEYDEDKFMVGYASGEDARKAFLRNMPEWAFGSMTGMSMGRFRKLVGQ